MQFRVNIKPKKYLKTSVFAENMYAPVQSTKEEVKNDVFSNHKYVFGGNVSCHISFDGKTARVASFQKIRRKTVEVTDKRLLKKGIKRQVFRPTHWVATYYDIPISLLRMMNVRLVQGWNNWKIEPLK